MLHPNLSSPGLPSGCIAHPGRHKIFVGMASGVGKTYRMLDEAQQLKRQGKDVVIGLLETHDRQDTAAKAEELEGEFLQVDGFDIAIAIAHIAKIHHITQVILGKTHKLPWHFSLRRCLIDRLLELLDPTELHIISTS